MTLALNPWIGMSAVMLILCTVLQLLSAVQRRFAPPAEMIRKSLHVIMGLVCLSFPFVFSETWPVVVLSIATACFLASLQFVKGHGLTWCDVLDATRRRSAGQICFPLGVGIVFALSQGNALLYCIPVLALTLADALSAIIGIRYGRHEFTTVDGHKTHEGSYAFFLAAFLGSFIPLMCFASLPLVNVVLIGLILGVLGTLFEAVAWRGLDNLFVPLGTYVVLKSHLAVATPELLLRFIVLCAILVFTILWRKRTTLHGAAALGVVVYSYFSWVMGGLIWTVIPLILFATYRWLMPRRFRSDQDRHSIYAVLSVASAGLMWLLCAEQFNAPHLLYPYTLAFGSHCAIIMIAHMKAHSLKGPRKYLLFAAVLKSWCLLFLPLILLQGLSTHLGNQLSSQFGSQLVVNLLFAPICIALPTLLFFVTHNDEAEPLTSKRRWFRQAACAGLGSTLGLIPYMVLG